MKRAEAAFPMAGFADCLQQRLAGLKERLHRWRRDGDSADDFLTQASATLERLTELSEEPRENSTLPRLVQLYTQAVLDITYFEENQLVDEEFPEESSLWKVEDLIHVLSEPEVLADESGASQEPFTVLSTELLECLYWRRGALLYMFCHTVKGRKEWLTKKTDLLKKFLNEGIHYLVKMLEFRCSDNPHEEFFSQDAATARLVHEGIFSDTHLLAMMYCGEMCYWGLKYCAKGKEPRQSTDPEPNSEEPGSSHIKVLDFRETGEKMLQKYIAACEGPLRLHDWDTKNAKLILDYFKQLSA
ncbi:RAB7A-interacting MON1-CCZ1 complex subunit 1 [Elgaria multicarinata webbii]|uniref:RAB7A-interacting MON1-CCZ1 complex subunit 1 n=1 Tax=Elgaria multicarinata webbii TaxID=159646 RepID=UPI002FCD62DB